MIDDYFKWILNLLEIRYDIAQAGFAGGEDDKSGSAHVKIRNFVSC